MVAEDRRDAASQGSGGGRAVPRALPLSWLAALVALGTTLLAWGARRLVEGTLTYGVPVRVFGEVFRLTRGENSGVAFNLLRDSPLVPWLSLFALALVAVYLARTLRGRAAGQVAIGLVLGGGLANLLDRLGDGRVTDYLDFGLGSWRYATFNLPDTAIVIGMALAVFASLREAARA